MKTLKVPYVSPNQRALPADLNELGAQVINGVANVVGHLLINPADNGDGMVAWGLQVTAVGAGQPMAVKVARGAGILKSPRNPADGSIPPTDEGLALVENAETLYVTLPSGVANRTYVVYLVGALEPGDVEPRDFRQVTVLGDAIQSMATPTMRRVKPSLVARYDGVQPQHSIKVATVLVEANSVALEAGNITDSRTMMWTRSSFNYRGVRGLVNSIRDSLGSLTDAFAALFERVGTAEDEIVAAKASIDFALTARCNVQTFVDEIGFLVADWRGTNIQSVARNSFGNYTITLSDDFVASADPQVACNSRWRFDVVPQPFDSESFGVVDGGDYRFWVDSGVRFVVTMPDASTINVKCVVFDPEAGLFKYADIPFSLDLSGPLTTGATSFAHRPEV